MIEVRPAEPEDSAFARRTLEDRPVRHLLELRLGL